MKPGTCNSCSKSIFWVTTPAGEWMPIDREPRDDGNVYVDEHDVAHVQGKRQAAPAGQVALGFDAGRRYRPHWASCPHADTHRKAPK